MTSYKSIALATALFLTACAAPTSDGDVLLVVDYTPEFQAAAAAEYKLLPVSCQQNDPTTPPGCSSLKTIINDYLHLRQRMRLR